MKAKKLQNEYLVQGLENGVVTDCLTSYCIKSSTEKMMGSWSTWFDEVIMYDITDPCHPVKMSSINKNKCNHNWEYSPKGFTSGTRLRVCTKCKASETANTPY